MLNNNFKNNIINFNYIITVLSLLIYLTKINKYNSFLKPY